MKKRNYTKHSDPNCQCASCRSKRGDSPLYGKAVGYENHKIDCQCCICKAERGELKHKLDCQCCYCKTKRGETKGKNNPMKRPEVKAKRIGLNCHWYRDGSCCNGSLISYHPNFTLGFRSSIRNRDNYVCMICKLGEEHLDYNLSVHHIHYDPMNNCSNPDDFISLCRYCHNLTTSGDRKYWTRVCEGIIEKNYCLRKTG